MSLLLFLYHTTHNKITQLDIEQRINNKVIMHCDATLCTHSNVITHGDITMDVPSNVDMRRKYFICTRRKYPLWFHNGHLYPLWCHNECLLSCHTDWSPLTWLIYSQRSLTCISYKTDHNMEQYGPFWRFYKETAILYFGMVIYKKMRTLATSDAIKWGSLLKPHLYKFNFNYPWII